MSATPGADNNFEQDPEDLQREAEAIRADMDRTLDALERKLSPKQLLDSSLSFVQANGGDLLQKLGATVNKNPLPLLLTSAGLVWLVASSRRSSSSRFEGASSSPRSGDFNRATQSFQEATYEGSSRVKRAASQLRQRASRTYGATRERTYEVGRNLNGLVQEQPLVCGAIALAVGAVIGAAFPASRFERDLVARARESAGPLLDEMSQSLQGAASGSETTASAPSSQTSH